MAYLVKEKQQIVSLLRKVKYPKNSLNNHKKTKVPITRTGSRESVKYSVKRAIIYRIDHNTIRSKSLGENMCK